MDTTWIQSLHPDTTTQNECHSHFSGYDRPYLLFLVVLRKKHYLHLEILEKESVLFAQKYDDVQAIFRIERFSWYYLSWIFPPWVRSWTRNLKGGSGQLLEVVNMEAFPPG
jgi:hypothetical protein